jgi:hypothetical protein
MVMDSPCSLVNYLELHDLIDNKIYNKNILPNSENPTGYYSLLRVPESTHDWSDKIIAPLLVTLRIKESICLYPWVFYKARPDLLLTTYHRLMINWIFLLLVLHTNLR